MDCPTGKNVGILRGLKSKTDEMTVKIKTKMPTPANTLDNTRVHLLVVKYQNLIRVFSLTLIILEIIRQVLLNFTKGTVRSL